MKIVASSCAELVLVLQDIQPSSTAAFSARGHVCIFDQLLLPARHAKRSAEEWPVPPQATCDRRIWHEARIPVARSKTIISRKDDNSSHPRPLPFAWPHASSEECPWTSWWEPRPVYVLCHTVANVHMIDEDLPGAWLLNSCT